MLVCRRWRVAFDCSTTCRIGEKFAAPSRNADLVIEACSGRLPAAKGRLWHPVAFLRIARRAGFKFLHATHQLRHIPLYVERMQGFIDYGVTTPFKPMPCVFVVGRGNLDVVLLTLAQSNPKPEEGSMPLRALSTLLFLNHRRRLSSSIKPSIAALVLY
jgi:hypothetical protein